MTKLEALAAQAVSEARVASDAAPGIVRSDAEAVNAKATRELYAAREFLEGRVAGLAAQNASRPEIDESRRLVEAEADVRT